MADISKITIANTNIEYDIKDSNARERISALESYSDYLGVTTTVLEDNVTTSPIIVVGGESKTAVKGNIANYGSKEFIFNGQVWQEFGDLSGLGGLAFKNNASASYTPTGDVSKPNTTVEFNTATVNSITSVGALPTFEVSGETLIITAGTLPTKGSDQQVVTSVIVDVSQPSFTGTQTTITVT